MGFRNLLRGRDGFKVDKEILGRSVNRTKGAFLQKDREGHKIRDGYVGQKSMLRIYLHRRSITDGIMDPRWSRLRFARAFACQDVCEGSWCPPPDSLPSSHFAIVHER